LIQNLEQVGLIKVDRKVFKKDGVFTKNNTYEIIHNGK